MIKRIKTILLFLGLVIKLSGQTTSEISLKALPVGSVGLQFHTENLFFNFGGPNVRLNRGNYGISVGVYPSVRIRLDDRPANASIVSTILGVGGATYFGKLSVVYVAYFPPPLPTANSPLVFHTIGLGVKIGK